MRGEGPGEGGADANAQHLEGQARERVERPPDDGDQADRDDPARRNPPEDGTSSSPLLLAIAA